MATHSCLHLTHAYFEHRSSTYLEPGSFFNISFFPITLDSGLLSKIYSVAGPTPPCRSLKPIARDRWPVHRLPSSITFPYSEQLSVFWDSLPSKCNHHPQAYPKSTLGPARSRRYVDDSNSVHHTLRRLKPSLSTHALPTPIDIRHLSVFLYISHPEHHDRIQIHVHSQHWY
jgi:hypothetical protein